jgi:hypothetical protein
MSQQINQGISMRIIIVALVILFSSIVNANEGFQLGVILGAPTGLSGKVSLANNHAIDFAIAHSLSSDLKFVFHTDYLIDDARSFAIGAPQPLKLYYGIGARVGFFEHEKHRDDDLKLGVRGPIGVSYSITNPNLQFFGELALILNIVPASDVDVDGAIGVRYMF